MGTEEAQDQTDIDFNRPTSPCSMRGNTRGSREVRSSSARSFRQAPEFPLPPSTPTALRCPLPNTSPTFAHTPTDNSSHEACAPRWSACDDSCSFRSGASKITRQGSAAWTGPDGKNKISRRHRQRWPMGIRDFFGAAQRSALANGN